MNIKVAAFTVSEKSSYTEDVHGFVFFFDKSIALYTKSFLFQFRGYTMVLLVTVPCHCISLTLHNSVLVN